MSSLEIGKSGIKVPYLGLGTWAIGGGAWWGANDDSLSEKTIQEAVDRGVVWLDTAPVYGLGHSEEVVGRALKGIRDKVIVSSKCAVEWRHPTKVFHKTVDGVPVYRDHSKKSIIEDCEESLRRLQTDHLDVLFTHWQTTNFDLYPLEETMDALLTLKKQGKIRAIGASNVTPEILRAYCSLGELDVIQEKYSICTRKIENDLIPMCRELGVSVQAYSPLEQGLLTGKVTMDSVYPEGDVRNNNPNFSPERRAKVLQLLSGWKDLCEKYQCSYGSLLIAFTALHAEPLFVLAGARKPEQIKANVQALQIRIEAADITRMTADLSVLAV